MTHLDILIPFALPPTELSSDLRKELDAPSLATLTTRVRADSSAASRETFDGYARALPHEIWLTRQFGLEAGLQIGSSPPIAASLLHSFGQQTDEGVWFVLQPVHIHIARDHLVLTDPRSLRLEEAESRALFDIAHPLFEEYGKPLLYGDANHWFVRADDWARLLTATPDAASGHNIDLWMPRGEGERDWRKLQNEVQMHWHSQAVNNAREERGLRPVNSLWLWGGAHATRRASVPYDSTFNLRDWAHACAYQAEQEKRTAQGPQQPKVAHATHPGDLFSQDSEHALLMLDHLLEPALAGDWGRWLECMRAIEQDWLTPLLDALRAGTLDEVSLIATGDIRLARFTATRSSLRKFWIKPAMSAFLP